MTITSRAARHGKLTGSRALATSIRERRSRWVRASRSWAARRQHRQPRPRSRRHPTRLRLAGSGPVPPSRLPLDRDRGHRRPHPTRRHPPAHPRRHLQRRRGEPAHRPLHAGVRCHRYDRALWVRSHEPGPGGRRRGEARDPGGVSAAAVASRNLLTPKAQSLTMLLRSVNQEADLQRHPRHKLGFQAAAPAVSGSAEVG